MEATIRELTRATVVCLRKGILYSCKKDEVLYKRTWNDAQEIFSRERSKVQPMYIIIFWCTLENKNMYANMYCICIKKY